MGGLYNRNHTLKHLVANGKTMALCHSVSVSGTEKILCGMYRRLSYDPRRKCSKEDDKLSIYIFSEDLNIF